MEVLVQFSFSRLSLTLLVAGGLLSSSCSSPLVSRRARTLRQGEVELGVVPYIQVLALAPTSGTNLAPFYPFAEAAARFGLFDKADLQIKIDPTIIPEINFAYQIVGDPSKNEFAVTLGLGLKPTILGLGTATAGFVNAPIYVGADLPFGDNNAFTFGARIIPNVLFGDVSGVGATVIGVAPGVFGALHLQFANFFIRPELAVNAGTTIAAIGSTGSAFQPNLNTVSVSGALGLGLSFDFVSRDDPAKDSKPGVFVPDAPPPPVAVPTPAASDAPPAPADPASP